MGPATSLAPLPSLEDPARSPDRVRERPTPAGTGRAPLRAPFDLVAPWFAQMATRGFDVCERCSAPGGSAPRHRVGVRPQSPDFRPAEPKLKAMYIAR
jgi:hypothetical protein